MLPVNVVTLKPDKGNGIVLLNTNHYNNGVEKLFQKKLKFKQFLEDPIPSRLSSVQRYLKKLNKRSKLTNDMYCKIRLKSAKLAWPHGLPKIHNSFENIPSFRPILDTTGTRHYSFGKYLSELLNPLTHNDYSLKDSFDTATRISRILPEVRDNDAYMFISLNVTSPFTNVPLRKTINIFVKRMSNKKQIPTSLSKRSLKKLILDTCQKRSFSSNNKTYEQLDGVSMSGSHGPVLAECEKAIVDKLIEDGIIKFYIRYVDDNLPVMKRTDISYVLNKFNSLDDNLKFTIDTFENCVPHFLDIEIFPNGLGIYHKHTQTGQYVNFDSFILWNWKVSWICTLVTTARRSRLENYLDKEIQLIKNYAAWNGYPKHINNSIVKPPLCDKESSNITEKSSRDTVKIFIDLKFSGNTGDRIVKNYIKELYESFKKEVTVKFVLHYQTTKLSYLTNTKDKTAFLSQSSVINNFVGPGCKSCYVGETDRILHERTKEHAYAKGNKNEQSAIYEHLSLCTHYSHIADLFKIDTNSFNSNQFNVSQIRDTTIILDRVNNWNVLLFKEALMIKRHRATLNCGLMASKELQLF